jgi:Aldehyde dehydrogenase family
MRLSGSARRQKFTFVFQWGLRGSIGGERLGRFGFICAPSASRGHLGERAGDPLHRARINAKALGDAAHTLTSAFTLVQGREGAKLVVDGRNFKLQGYENGNFIGGCLFDGVRPNMRIYKEEIFVPPLASMMKQASVSSTVHGGGKRRLGIAIRPLGRRMHRSNELHAQSLQLPLI